MPLTVVNATKAVIKIKARGALAVAAIGTIVIRSVGDIVACGLDMIHGAGIRLACIKLCRGGGAGNWYTARELHREVDGLPEGVGGAIIAVIQTHPNQQRLAAFNISRRDIVGDGRAQPMLVIVVVIVACKASEVSWAVDHVQRQHRVAS
jgi:hypothetical protein